MESTLTTQEITRVQTLQRLLGGYLTQRAAACELGLSVRHVHRLLGRLRDGGVAAMASRRRCRAPNNQIDAATCRRILERCRSDYLGFGPTFLAQTLAQRDEISVSREWLRRLLIENALWKSKRRKRNLHPLRERRPRFGELMQMDGSPHNWFEGRAPECTLLLAVDDATSRICSARFEPTETTDGYFRLTRSHIERYGRFLAAYPDKHSIFRYSGQSVASDVTTQYQRACNELDVELICANSPQAKGRVERANRTLQDRLVKAMRLANICDMEVANAFLPGFLENHNAQFAREPACSDDAHRSASGFDLDYILCRRKERVITKNLMFQISDTIYALTDAYSKRNIVTGARVELRIHTDGRMTGHHGSHELSVKSLGKRARNAPIVGAKDLNAHLDRRLPNPRKAHKPALNHPWT